MAVVVVPAIDARAERQHQLVDRREDVLHERAEALLRAAGHALHRQRRRLRARGGTIGRSAPSATYAASWLSPSTHRQSKPALKAFVRAERLGPLRHAADAVGRHVLIGRQADDVARRRRRW